MSAIASTSTANRAALPFAPWPPAMLQTLEDWLPPANSFAMEYVPEAAATTVRQAALRAFDRHGQELSDEGFEALLWEELYAVIDDCRQAGRLNAILVPSQTIDTPTGIGVWPPTLVEIVERWLPRAIDWAQARLLNHDRADAVEAALTAAGKAIELYDECHSGANFEALASSNLRFIVLEENRQLARYWGMHQSLSDSFGEEGASDALVPIAELPETEDVEFVNARHLALQKALKLLPNRTRSFLLLGFWARFTQAEIAAAHGVSVPIVKTTLFRARQLMKKEIERELRRDVRYPGFQHFSVQPRPTIHRKIKIP